MQGTQPAAVPPQTEIDEVLRLYEEKHNKEAMDKAQALVKAFPRHPVLYNIAGVILAEVRQWENATKAYRQAIGLKADYAEAYYNFAKIPRAPKAE